MSRLTLRERAALWVLAGIVCLPVEALIRHYWPEIYRPMFQGVHWYAWLLAAWTFGRSAEQRRAGRDLGTEGTPE